MDLCAPCDCYERATWGRSLHLEDCCLNCAHLQEQIPCPTLCARIYPDSPATRPVEGGGPRHTLVPTTCAGCEGSGAGGES
jgi:hypothetical protein